MVLEASGNLKQLWKGAGSLKHL